MYNYFSVGVDAQVTFNFHKARESPLYMISSRVFNKVFFPWITNTDFNNIGRFRSAMLKFFFLGIPDSIFVFWNASSGLARLHWP